MTTEAPKTSPLIERMATEREMTPSTFIDMVKKQCFPDAGANATQDQIMALLSMSSKYDLDPIAKEIWAFPARGGKVVPVVSIDGWLKILNRQMTANGMKVVTNFKGDSSVVESVTVTMYRKDREHPTEVTEYLAECKMSTPIWQQRPIRMLRNRAIAQAIRNTFAIAGIYDITEAEDIAHFGGATTDENANAKAETANKSAVEGLKERLKKAQPEPASGVASLSSQPARDSHADANARAAAHGFPVTDINSAPTATAPASEPQAQPNVERARLPKRQAPTDKPIF